MHITLVAAVAENGVIGSDGEMPWSYPEDLRHFRETTLGSPVVMGRKTYESIVAKIGGPLDQRTNLVLSTTMDAIRDDDVFVYRSIEAVRETVDTFSDDTLYVIGGATIYEQFLPYAEEMVLTEVPGTPEGDTYFPTWDADEWRETARESSGDLSFVTYRRD
jgi:dihydrofolate reductase